MFKKKLKIKAISTLNFKLFRSWAEGKHSRKRIQDTVDIVIKSKNGDKKIMQSIRITSGPSTRIRKTNQFCQFR